MKHSLSFRELIKIFPNLLLLQRKFHLIFGVSRWIISIEGENYKWNLLTSTIWEVTSVSLSSANFSFFMKERFFSITNSINLSAIVMGDGILLRNFISLCDELIERHSAQLFLPFCRQLSSIPTIKIGASHIKLTNNNPNK